MAEQLERAIERGREVARVVGDPHAVLVRDARPVRHLARLHEVAPADVDRVEAQTASADVEEPLHDEDRLRSPRAAVGGVLRLVRYVAGADVPVIGHTVGSRQVDHGVEREPAALDRVGAHVGLEDAVDAHDRSIASEGDPRPVDLLAVVSRGDEMLATALDPLDRSSQTERDGRHEQLLVVDGALRDRIRRPRRGRAPGPLRPGARGPRTRRPARHRGSASKTRRRAGRTRCPGRRRRHGARSARP